VNFAGALDRLDSIGLSRLLVPNGILAIFVLLAHGGWLLLARAGKAPAGPLDWVPYLSVPIAAVFVVLSVVAAIWPGTRTRVLKLQTFGLACLAAFLLLFALDIMSAGPRTERFAWNPVLFAFLLAYPVYLIRRVFVAPSALKQPFLRYAHVIASVFALVVSAAVMWRASAA
jgi:hypothetical protein